MKSNDSELVQSLVRAFQILECLSKNKDGSTLKLLSEQTGLHKSTLHRLLHTMVELGYVHQQASNERYYLGTNLIRLSTSLLDNLDVRQVARPVLQALCNQTGEASHLSVRDNGYAVYIEKIENPRNPIRMYSQIGKAIPLHCSASGKSLLAGASREEVKAILGEGPFRPFTSHTITSFEQLYEQISKVSNCGYATDWFEHEDNVYCVASPVYDNAGQVIAAVSVAGTTLQLNPERFWEYCAAVNKAATDISTQMGGASYAAPFNPNLVDTFRPPLMPK